MNKAIIKGNITRQPEVSYTPKGTAICSFGVAVSKRWKNDAGEQHEKTTFIECKCWGKTGEVICQHFDKGSPILLEGELDVEQWEDKQSGQKRSKMLVLVQNFEFCGDKRQAEEKPQGRTQRPPQRETRQAPARQPAKPAEEVADDDFQEDDEIPF